MNKKQILQALEPLDKSKLCYKSSAIDHNHPFLKQGIRQLKESALRYQNKPAGVLSYDLFRQYWENGNRVNYQEVYYDKRGRLLTYALLSWLLESETGYLSELENILWDICSEPMWSLPAHFMNSREEDLPMEEYPLQLDLFACETGLAICETLLLCGGRLSRRCREFAEIQLKKRILDPFLDGNHFYRFEQMSNNWAAVCAGAIGSVALITMEDKEKLANLLHRVSSCIEIYLDSFGQDGVCTEGVGYWTYGFGFFVCFADYLAKRTGNRIDYFKEEKVKAIALNQQHYYIKDNYTISFADGWPRTNYRAGLSMYLKKRYPEIQLPALKFALGLLEDSCHRFCLSLRDLVWFDPEAETGETSRESVWLQDAQWFISRGEVFAVAAKAGHNGESHNHNDCGSFVLYKAGVPLLEDLGAGIYDAEYFGPNRYQVFVNSSRSHNVPLILGKEQAAGEEHRAKEAVAAFGTKDIFSVQLEECYLCEPLIRFHRELIHDRQGDRVELRDTFVLEEEGVITEVFLSHSPIRIEEGRAVIQNREAAIELSYDHSLLGAEVREEIYHDHQGSRKAVNVLQISNRVKTRELKVIITII